MESRPAPRRRFDPSKGLRGASRRSHPRRPDRKAEARIRPALEGVPDVVMLLLPLASSPVTTPLRREPETGAAARPPRDHQECTGYARRLAAFPNPWRAVCQCPVSPRMPCIGPGRDSGGSFGHRDRSGQAVGKFRPIRAEKSGTTRPTPSAPVVNERPGRWPGPSARKKPDQTFDPWGEALQSRKWDLKELKEFSRAFQVSSTCPLSWTHRFSPASAISSIRLRMFWRCSLITGE